MTETVIAVGGTDDPILDHPSGANFQYNSIYFEDGMCTAAFDSTTGVCSDARRPLAATFAAFVFLFSDLNICAPVCTPAAEGNDRCRDGYTCDQIGGFCDVGCTSDDQCRVTRQDTDNSGTLEVWDPTTMTGDHLVYDTESTATCDLQSSRCRHSGTAGAEAGDACTRDDDCEADGLCVGSWPGGGYCTKLACDLWATSARATVIVRRAA
ncbi:MAG: hypothetical protein R3A47_07290 [Polyangiales bacterium]